MQAVRARCVILVSGEGVTKRSHPLERGRRAPHFAQGRQPMSIQVGAAKVKQILLKS
jgi:hypothetical protein